MPSKGVGVVLPDSKEARAMWEAIREPFDTFRDLAQQLVALRATRRM